MERIRVFIPEWPVDTYTSNTEIDEADVQRLNIDDDTDTCRAVYDALIKSERKISAYFDEEVCTYFVLEADIAPKGNLSVEVRYGTEKAHSHDIPPKNLDHNNIVQTLASPDYVSNGLMIWKFRFKIAPGRNHSNIHISCSFNKEAIAVNDNLQPFREINLIQIEGIDLFSESSTNLSNTTDATTDPIEGSSASSSHLSTLVVATDLSISSIYKMSLKSFKTEKTLAWLDLGMSKASIEYGAHIEIQSITVDSMNCEISPITPVTFPLPLTSSSLLTLVYNVQYDEEYTMKPLIVKIEAILDGYKHINTKWTSNLDLTNRQHPYNQSGSTLSLNNKRIQQSSGLLPAAKLSKLRSYNNLISSHNSPKLPPPPRSVSVSSAIPTSGHFRSGSSTPASTTSVQGKSGMGGKRFSSVKFKSGSNISLNQLWSDSVTQNFQRGLVVTVTGPTRVELGQSFKWRIQLLNKSTDKMDLILYVQSSIKKEYEKTVPPIPTLSGNKKDPVPLFSNNQLVRSFYYKFNRAGLLSLTNNLRVSLEYGNLYECELELLGLERGMFNIYDFKLLDVVSGDIFECNRLLDVQII